MVGAGRPRWRLGRIQTIVQLPYMSNFWSSCRSSDPNYVRSRGSGLWMFHVKPHSPATSSGDTPPRQAVVPRRTLVSVNACTRDAEGQRASQLSDRPEFTAQGPRSRPGKITRPQNITLFHVKPADARLDEPPERMPQGARLRCFGAHDTRTWGMGTLPGQLDSACSGRGEYLSGPGWLAVGRLMPLRPRRGPTAGRRQFCRHRWHC